MPVQSCHSWPQNLSFQCSQKWGTLEMNGIKKIMNIMPVRSCHRWPQNLSFQCCKKWGSLEMKGIKNREHHACPVMPPLAAKSSISGLSTMENSRDERTKKNREHHACPVIPPLAAKLYISAVLRIRIY
jgi:hypothetical protein